MDPNGSFIQLTAATRSYDAKIREVSLVNGPRVFERKDWSNMSATSVKRQGGTFFMALKQLFPQLALQHFVLSVLSTIEHNKCNNDHHESSGCANQWVLVLSTLLDAREGSDCFTDKSCTPGSLVARWTMEHTGAIEQSQPVSTSGT